jgi:multidrug efflux pump subunit AcrA (membrane-fusion protein)
VNGVSYFTAEIALQPDPALKVGLSAEVKIAGQKAPNAVTISMNALLFDQNNAPYVLVKNSEGKTAPKLVTVGMNDGTRAEIKSGLKAGDTVLVAKNAAVSSSKAPGPGGGGMFHAARKASN